MIVYLLDTIRFNVTRIYLGFDGNVMGFSMRLKGGSSEDVINQEFLRLSNL